MVVVLCTAVWLCWWCQLIRIVLCVVECCVLVCWCTDNKKCTGTSAGTGTMLPVVCCVLYVVLLSVVH